MGRRGRGYRYVGPAESKAAVRAGDGRDMMLGLDAGEISFLCEAGRWTVSEVSNQSTGYCPSGFTCEVVFRRCPDCQEHNIVREDDFVCVFCGSDLPAVWNVDPTA
ncbi:hypothetical protein [Streptomyces sp. cg40]|uniref:hypothetical protein n=1 Tax=Streptomyces sp. cg40 TaxID=3419764 RepID=UPI003D014210